MRRHFCRHAQRHLCFTVFVQPDVEERGNPSKVSPPKITPKGPQSTSHEVGTGISLSLLARGADQLHCKESGHISKCKRSNQNQRAADGSVQTSRARRLVGWLFEGDFAPAKELTRYPWIVLFVEKACCQYGFSLACENRAKMRAGGYDPPGCEHTLWASAKTKLVVSGARRRGEQLQSSNFLLWPKGLSSLPYEGKWTVSCMHVVAEIRL